MGLRIGTNLASINARRNLSKATGALQRNFERLSTGKRIARASDDAAGLSISSRLRKDIRSLDAASRNANDGISLVQTAEGGLAEIEDSLIRMRELAVQANNGTLSNSDKDTLQSEFSALQSSIDQIANTTDFNGIALLNDGSSSITLQVGADASTNDQYSVSTVDVTASGLSISTLDIGSSGDASAAIAALDTALTTVSDNRATFGAAQNRLESTISNLSVQVESLSAANSRILDVDVARETADLTKNSILQQAAISVLAQANLQPSSALSLIG